MMALLFMVAIMLPSCVFGRSIKCGPRNACSCTKPTKLAVAVDCHNAKLGVSEICKLCELISDISTLDISNIKLEGPLIIPGGCFNRCYNLKQLSLASNNINTLDDKVFKKMHKLNVLNLDSNALINDRQFVNPKIFKHLINLSTLYLQGNKNRSSTRRSQPYLSNIPINFFPALGQLYIDGVENIRFDRNFHYFRKLRKIDFTGVYSVCNIVSLTRKSFENVNQLDYLNLAFCNISYIEAETFQWLAEMTYLNLSHNEGLSFLSLRNVSYGLQSGNIRILDYSKVYKEFGLNTELRTCDVWFLKNTTLKELHMNQNRLALVEVNALRLFPSSLEVLSVERNQLSYGPYVLQIGCLRNLTRLEISHQYHFASIKAYNAEANITEKANDNHEVCPVPKPETIDIHCPYLDNGPFNLLTISCPPKLKVINFRDSNVKTFITDHPHIIPLPVKSEIESMDASFNVIYGWNAPVTLFETLKHINLSNNFATFMSDNFFTRAPNLQTLDASNNLLGPFLSEDITGQIFEPLKQLEILNLSANKITSVPTQLFSHLDKTASLNLAFNGISDIRTSLESLRNLSNLDLRQNKIYTLPLTLLEQMDYLAKRESRNVSIDLSNNTLEISCDNLKFLEWVINHPRYFKDLDFYIYRNKGSNSVMSHEDLTKTVESLNKGCRSYTATIILSTIFIVGFLCVIVVGLVYRFRWRLRYLYYMAKSRYRGYERIPSTAIEYRYDAFISYDHEDYLFIKDEIIVELEDNHGLALCVHQRDFLPGNYIAENILQAIKNSRMIVIVLTDRFLKSKWCIYEFNMARMERIYSRDGQKFIVCIMYEDIDTKHQSPELIQSLESETFLRYPQDENEKPYFWEMLKRALNY